MASILFIRFAWGLQEMIAGFVLLSAAIGMVVMGLTVALSLPLWVSVIAYPVVCSLTLLLLAALWNIRSNVPATQDAIAGQYSHG